MRVSFDTMSLQGIFLDLVLILTAVWYALDSKFYQQTDIVSIKGPAS